MAVNYIVVKKASGVIVEQISGAVNYPDRDKDQYSVFEAPKGNHLGKQASAEGEILDLPAEDMPVSRRDINEALTAIKMSAVALPNGDTYQFDIESEITMRDAIEFFDDLDGLDDGRIKWILADNTSKLMTKEELKHTYDQCRRVRAIRGSRLYAKSEEIKTKPGPAKLKDINDLKRLNR